MKNNAVLFHPKRLYLIQKGECFYCGTNLDPFSYDPVVSKTGWTRDHFVPRKHLKKLKMTPKYNLVLSCKRCNLKKGHSLPTKRQLIKFVSVVNQLMGSL